MNKVHFSSEKLTFNFRNALVEGSRNPICLARLITSSDVLRIPTELHLLSPAWNLRNGRILKFAFLFLLSYRIFIALNYRNYKSKTFNSKFYLEYHADLNDYRSSAWLHYQIFGASEKRVTTFWLQPQKFEYFQKKNLDLNDLTFVSRYWQLPLSNYVQLQFKRDSNLDVHPIFFLSIKKIKKNLTLNHLANFDMYFLKSNNQLKIELKYLLSS